MVTIYIDMYVCTYAYFFFNGDTINLADECRISFKKRNKNNNSREKRKIKTGYSSM